VRKLFDFGVISGVHFRAAERLFRLQLRRPRAGDFLDAQRLVSRHGFSAVRAVDDKLVSAKTTRDQILHLEFLAQHKKSLTLRQTRDKPTKTISRKAQEDKSIDVFVDWMGWSSWFHGMAISFLVCTCVILRTHLFIWTVFSPKFLFQAVWLGLHHILVEGIMGGLIWLIS